MKLDREIAFLLGRPLSPLYAGLMRLRATGYRRGWLASSRLPVPVVSVGNLTMGGTGKTPMVMAIARLLLAAGRRPAVVSRGYGGRATGAVNLVSDGQQLLLSARVAGDEPRLLAEALPGVVVATGVARSRVARHVIDELAADVIILDDGFQHLAVQRNLDLVLFKGRDFLGNGRVFPGGDLREPVSALARAHAFVLTGEEGEISGPGRDFGDWLAEHFPGRPIFPVPYRIGDPQPANANAIGSLTRGARILAFCGLANPEPFGRMLRASGYELADFRVFADHHSYTSDDLLALDRRAGNLGAAALVTTAKDLVKLHQFHCARPLYVLPVELSLPADLRRLVNGCFER